jgi:hypothetical protein
MTWIIWLWVSVASATDGAYFPFPDQPFSTQEACQLVGVDLVTENYANKFLCLPKGQEPSKQEIN